MAPGRKSAPPTPAKSAGKPVVKMVRKPAAKARKKPVSSPEPAVAQPVLRKKELIERVVARSGVKKKYAKPTIETMLSVLGEALANGEQLNLVPMGKIVVKREKEQANAKVLVCRIRQPKKS